MPTVVFTATQLARTASWSRRAYILPLWFFLLLSFFRRLISEVTERIWTKRGHIFTYDCYLRNIWSELLRAFTSTGWGQKHPLCWDRFWTMTEHISATEHDINNRKKTCQSTGTPIHAPNFVNFGPQTAENSWRIFSHPPPTFLLWGTLPALLHARYTTDSRHTLARVM